MEIFLLLAILSLVSGFIFPRPFQSRWAIRARTYLDISFEEKDSVKQLGAKYDLAAKKWFIPEGVSVELFDKWKKIESPSANSVSEQATSSSQLSHPSQDRIFLNVPFSDKDKVKSLGARWVTESKRWYVPSGAQIQLFESWISSNPQAVTKMSSDRVYQKVPFDEKQDAKNAGAKWDQDTRMWYVPAAAMSDALSKWVDVKSISESKETEASKVIEPGRNVEEDTAEKEPTTSDKAKKAKKGDGGATATKRVKKSAAPFQPTNNELVAAGPLPVAGELIAIFDVDTNGLPNYLSGYPFYNNTRAYDSCRVIQLSYVVAYKQNMTVVRNETVLIKASDFEIKNVEFHGITTLTSQRYGRPFVDVARELVPLLKSCQSMISHNNEFDFNVFMSELHRYGLQDLIADMNGLTRYCSMKGFQEELALTNARGDRKPPSIKEVYKYATGQELEYTHTNAKQDVTQLHQALKALNDKGQLNWEKLRVSGK